MPDSPYKHDDVTVTIDNQKVKVPTKPHPSIDPTAFITSVRTGQKVPIVEIQRLYNIHGSYLKVAKLTGISDKTIKKYVQESGPVSDLKQIHPVEKSNRGRAVIRKATKIANQWMGESADDLSSAMSSLLTSINDSEAIRRAPLRDRAIAFGILTERLQKSQELGIRQQEADIKRIEVGRKNEEIELKKREVAAMEKGITINIGRKFQDVTDFVEVEEVIPNGK